MSEYEIKINNKLSCGKHDIIIFFFMHVFKHDNFFKHDTTRHLIFFFFLFFFIQTSIKRFANNVKIKLIYEKFKKKKME